MTDDQRTLLLLTAIDNALRNGSYMTGANYAFTELCDDLGVNRDRLPMFDPEWSSKLPRPASTPVDALGYDDRQCQDCECCTARECSLSHCGGRCPCVSG